MGFYSFSWETANSPWEVANPHGICFLSHGELQIPHGKLKITREIMIPHVIFRFSWENVTVPTGSRSFSWEMSRPPLLISHAVHHGICDLTMYHNAPHTFCMCFIFHNVEAPRLAILTKWPLFVDDRRSHCCKFLPQKHMRYV